MPPRLPQPRSHTRSPRIALAAPEGECSERTDIEVTDETQQLDAPDVRGIVENAASGRVRQDAASPPVEHHVVTASVRDRRSENVGRRRVSVLIFIRP